MFAIIIILTATMFSTFTDTETQQLPPVILQTKRGSGTRPSSPPAGQQLNFVNLAQVLRQRFDLPSKQTGQPSLEGISKLGNTATTTYKAHSAAQTSGISRPH